MLKTNVSHVHTIRKWPEDVNRSRYMRAFLHTNRKYQSNVGRQSRTPPNACKYIHLLDVMRFNDRINDWLSLFYRKYIATIKLIYRQPVYSLRINRKIETNRNGYNDCNGENRPNRRVYFFYFRKCLKTIESANFRPNRSGNLKHTYFFFRPYDLVSKIIVFGAYLLYYLM